MWPRGSINGLWFGRLRRLPLTQSDVKRRDDSRRFTAGLTTTGPSCTTGSLDFLTLAVYVTDLRARPRVHGVWRDSPDPQIG